MGGPWPVEIHDPIIEKMIRGLYFHHYGVILWDRAAVKVQWLRTLEDLENWSRRIDPSLEPLWTELPGAGNVGDISGIAMPPQFKVRCTLSGCSTSMARTSPEDIHRQSRSLIKVSFRDFLTAFASIPKNFGEPQETSNVSAVRLEPRECRASRIRAAKIIDDGDDNSGRIVYFLVT